MYTVGWTSQDLVPELVKKRMLGIEIFVQEKSVICDAVSHPTLVLRGSTSWEIFVQGFYIILDAAFLGKLPVWGSASVFWLSDSTEFCFVRVFTILCATSLVRDSWKNIHEREFMNWMGLDHFFEKSRLFKSRLTTAAKIINIAAKLTDYNRIII